MATGTGKTLTTAAVSRLFLQTGNAKRILFLVDRIELEDQAEKSLKGVLGESYIIKVFKRSRDDWRSAQIVISTVQSLLAGDRYRKEFSPTDFDLVISDEAHRSLGGNSRAVFEYFNGYKLGLTATPKDYLKNIKNENDPRASERREFLDTYRTFGCASGMPTFRYDLAQGAKDGYLVQPRVFDARTDITTQLLSDEGYQITITNDDGELEETFMHRDYEKKFFNTDTNIAFCKTFLEHAKKDPLSGEIGKSLIFCVSQPHARKIVEILNLMADKMYPGKYNSDFAMQVTSIIADAQDKTVQFSNNTLGGRSKFLDGYKTSKTRVCVTVGMMTTGYDCPDILNLAMMRPVFSPSDFVQMKGRGTRKNKFIFEDRRREKENFYLFDFFGNYEYFEEKFDYDAILELPVLQSCDGIGGGGDDIKKRIKELNLDQIDDIAMLSKTDVDEEGMRIDRELYHKKFEKAVQEDEDARKIYEEEGIEGVKKYVFANILNKPKEYFTPERLRKSITADRWISFREMLQKAFGEINEFPKLDDKTEEEFRKFQDIEELDADIVPEAKWFFSSYLQNKEVREVVHSGEFAHFNTMAGFDMQAFRKLASTKRNGVTYAQYIPTYVHDYIENVKEFERV